MRIQKMGATEYLLVPMEGTGKRTERVWYDTGHLAARGGQPVVGERWQEFPCCAAHFTPLQ